MGTARTGVSIVVPAFNEESRLGETLVDLTTFLAEQPWDWEVRVVDDGSTDGTCRIVDEHARVNANVVLQREPHRGKGGAVRAGLLAARAPFRFICDADLSMPVAELPRFLPPQLEHFDIAIGSREGFGARRIGEPLVRHLAGRTFNFAVQRLCVSGIEDTQCGFKMFTAAAVDAIFPLVTSRRMGVRHRGAVHRASERAAHRRGAGRVALSPRLAGEPAARRGVDVSRVDSNRRPRATRRIRSDW